MGRASNGATCGSTKATIPRRRLSAFENDADMNNMTATLKTHPLAVGSDGYKNFLFLEGKVNSQSSADDHESVYNVKFTTTLGFTLTMGYSRYNDQVGTTHAWIAFGEGCSSREQKKLGVDLLLNLVGYRCVYGSDHKVLALSSSVHPAVGGPDMGLSTYAPIRSASQAPWPGATPVAEAPAQPSASSSTPALAQAPVPSAQPLAATMLASSSVPEPAQAPASSAQPLAAMPSTSMAASSVSTTAQAPAPSAQPPASMVASSATAPAPAQAPAPSAQPWAGGASSVAPTSQPLAGMPCAQPPASMVASSATAPAPAQAPAPSAQPLRQPLAGGASSVAPPSQPSAGLPLMQVQQAKEQEDEGKDETDHEGLDVRPCLGEQDPEVVEQDRQRLEDLARSGEEWDSEAEELAFKNKVSAVTREQPPASRMFLVPKPRFKPAVGGAGGQQGPAVGGQDGGVDVSMDMHLHISVLSSRGGTQDFGLQEMTCVYDGA